MRVGAIAAGGGQREIDALGRFGREFGVGLQMLDDLTGITSEKRCHKGHEDLIECRPTWAWAWLAEKLDAVAYVRVRGLGEEVARRDLHPELLAEPVREIIAEPGRSAIRQHLRASLSALSGVFPEPRWSARLCEEVAHLERYDG